jgi:hypothetical protein
MQPGNELKEWETVLVGSFVSAGETVRDFGK